MEANERYIIAAIIFVLLTMQACAPRENPDSGVTSTMDTSRTPGSANAGIPLDNIDRKADADTLKAESNSNTGVPMSNINRDEKKDTTGQAQRTPE